MNYSIQQNRRPLIVPKVIPLSSWVPRPYQIQMISDIQSNRSKGHKRILVSAPPGSGKTGIMTALARMAYLTGKKTTILVPFNCVVTKSASELTQTCGALVSAGLNGCFGVISGAFPELLNINAPIQVVTLQSLAPYQEWLSDTDEIIIDEGHTGAFFKEAEKCYKSWRWKFVTSFTATPFNRGMGKDEKYGDLQRNTALVIAPPYRELERLGYLASLRYHALEYKVASGKKQDLESDKAILWMLTEWKNRCAEFNIPTTHMVGFTKSKRNGGNQTESIIRIGKTLGLNFAVVGDGINPNEYAALMADFEAGRINLLCCQALSTGWDSPLCRHIGLFRAIPSRDRCVQIATRCDRIHPSKKYGEIWDFAKNFQLMGEDSGLHPKVEDLSESINHSILETRTKGYGQAPTKICCNDSCKRRLFASAIVCDKCETIQPLSQVLYELPNGSMVSFVPESMARKDREGLRAFFHQQRKIAFVNGWKPFAAHKVCKDLGFNIPLDDSFFWMGSVGVDKNIYTEYLKKGARIWGWQQDKINNELRREFGNV